MTKIFSCIIAFIFFLSANTLIAHADETYVVKKGDSFHRIAKKFNVDADKIREVNSFDPAKLKPGMRLTIPSRDSKENKQCVINGGASSVKAREDSKTNVAPSRAAVPESALPQKGNQYHTVKRGETLSSLSRKYSLSVSDLKEFNNLGKSGKLRPGQRLLVKKIGPHTYTVRKGDTIKKIAKKFDLGDEELMEINGLETPDLKPGQKLLLEARVEEPDSKKYPVMSGAKISEEIATLAESQEIDSLGMKDRLILFAKKMLDIPYRFGGSSFMGIDCSAYVQKVFGLLDVPLPRTAREQFHLGEPIEKEELSMGDLVFFKTYASFPSHVGIYLGNNLFIHASSRSRKVSIDSLDTPYYIKRFIGAKRLFQNEIDEKREQEKG